MSVDLNNLAHGLIHREVKKLYLSFLYTVEDLRNEGSIDDIQFQRLRKRILDYGNNCYRNIEEELDTFDFKLKNE